MFEKKILVILLQLAILGVTEALLSVQANLPSCSYKCDSPKKEKGKDSKKIKDFYWRDYYFVIPPDAYQLGDDNQNPQTYVGLVFDPSKNGSFVTTIVKTQEYVYGVLDDKVSKISQQIQILCTMEPERMTWIELHNVDQLDGYLVVQGGLHVKHRNDSKYPAMVQHYVAKTSEDNVIYAGYSTGLNTSMSYATRDGNPKKIGKFLWLLYEEVPKEKNQNNKQKPFFNFNFNTKFNAGFSIPKFRHQIDIGSCSLVCTNQDKSITGKQKTFDERSKNAMVYYWRPNNVNSTKDDLQVGKSFSDKPLYTSQAYSMFLNSYDVGLGETDIVYLSSYVITEVAYRYFHTLGSTSQEKLVWINSTTKSFEQLDKTRLVPGGHLDNGTETFVGRTFFVNAYKPGSIRVLPHGTYCFLLYGVFEEFQVLSIKEEES